MRPLADLSRWDFDSSFNPATQKFCIMVNMNILGLKNCDGLNQAHTL